MIKHTYQDGRTVDLFCTRDVMEILKVASDETVRRRAKQCKVTGIKLRGVTAYNEADVLKMANYVHAKAKPQPLTDSTPNDLLVTAFEAAHMVGIPTMSFVRRAFELGIASNAKKLYSVAQVRDYVTRYPEYVAKRRQEPHTAMVFSTGSGQVQAVGVSEVVYEETTLNGVRYLHRADAPPAIGEYDISAHWQEMSTWRHVCGVR